MTRVNVCGCRVPWRRAHCTASLPLRPRPLGCVIGQLTGRDVTSRWCVIFGRVRQPTAFARRLAQERVASALVCDPVGFVLCGFGREGNQRVVLLHYLGI
jgi:hypothetical protein